MKVVFAGTPEFASHALDALLQSGHQVELVLTQPDRPAGRGMKCQPSAVKLSALNHAISVEQPVSLRLNGSHAEEARKVYEKIAQLKPDVMVVVAYGLILPKAFLALPKYGCLNIHASLLPRWRGAAPIQRAIEAGDSHTGVSIMQMEEGLDTGPILLQEAVAIEKNVNAAELHDRLARLGAGLISTALERIENGSAVFHAQPDEGVTYAAKIRKEEAIVDFTLPADTLDCRIRAFNPFPGCIALYERTPIKIWKARSSAQSVNAPPGQIVSADENGIVVACGTGSLTLDELQKPGARRLPAAEFIKGFSFEKGRFG